MSGDEPMTMRFDPALGAYVPDRAAAQGGAARHPQALSLPRNPPPEPMTERMPSQPPSSSPQPSQQQPASPMRPAPTSSRVRTSPHVQPPRRAQPPLGRAPSTTGPVPPARTPAVRSIVPSRSGRPPNAGRVRPPVPTGPPVPPATPYAPLRPRRASAGRPGVVVAAGAVLLVIGLLCAVVTGSAIAAVQGFGQDYGATLWDLGYRQLDYMYWDSLTPWYVLEFFTLGVCVLAALYGVALLRGRQNSTRVFATVLAVLLGLCWLPGVVAVLVVPALLWLPETSRRWFAPVGATQMP